MKVGRAVAPVGLLLLQQKGARLEAAGVVHVGALVHNQVVNLGLN